MKKNSHVIVVAGPTASGKSDFAVALAKKCNGEIISADSRQVYKGLDIGTGKITHEEMQGIPHHMLDVYTTGEEVSVARYAHEARPILEEILERGKTPIICGGTGQYIDALIFDTPIPKVPPDTALRTLLEKKETGELFRMLTEKDPLRAQTIDKHNRVRLIRSLEIIETLGAVPPTPPSSFVYPTTFYLLSPSRELLRKRITARLHKRLAMGMIEEVEKLLEQIPSISQLKRYGIEYAVIARYLKEEIDRATMEEEIITQSMRYAKRQMTWNRKYLPYATVVDVNL